MKREISQQLRTNRAPRAWAIALFGVVISLASPGTSRAAFKTQTFDSAASASDGGWTGFNNDPIAGTGGGGGFIKFSNTDNTLGDPAGEAGGDLSRTDNLRAYYADTAIGPPGASFNVGSVLTASGELYMKKGTPLADTVMAIGFINKNTANIVNPDDMIGFRILAANNAISAVAFGGDYGGYNGSGGDAGLAKSSAFADGAYTFSFTYTPGGFTLTGGQVNYGQITLSITPAGGGTTVVLRNALNPLQNRLSKTLNSFGMASFNVDDSNSTLTNTYFIDNVTYSAIPEPAMAVGAIPALLLARRRRRI